MTALFQNLILIGVIKGKFDVIKGNTSRILGFILIFSEFNQGNYISGFKKLV